MTVHSVLATIPSQFDGRLLELRVQQASLSPTEALVLVHPYAPLGGNFDNNVICALEAHWLRQFPDSMTVAINLRGAGRSQGRTSWSGRPEEHDVKTVVGWLTTGAKSPVANASTTLPDFDRSQLKRLILCGYSYGGIAVSALQPQDYPPALELLYIFISFPIGVMWALTLWRQRDCTRRIAHLASLAPLTTTPTDTIKPAPRVRTLLVAGDQDQFTGAQRYTAWWQKLRGIVQASNAGDAVETELFPGVDHFWFYHEKKLCQHIQAWATCG
ncbi:hypothetical protein H4R34_000822 [Dimargaris verticillata]|uniref:Alpha/Beta hydrolase protein n=1 Tax=Dimargaris verticillata TaxID=2761393 RepID=A0A9W8EF14_9FUNG|nr:hypothetical protein H4R34_000822 [Dimargaris verticillata]